MCSSKAFYQMARDFGYDNSHCVSYDVDDPEADELNYNPNGSLNSPNSSNSSNSSNTNTDNQCEYNDNCNCQNACDASIIIGLILIIEFMWGEL